MYVIQVDMQWADSMTTLNIVSTHTAGSHVNTADNMSVSKQHCAFRGFLMLSGAFCIYSDRTERIGSDMSQSPHEDYVFVFSPFLVSLFILVFPF